jgi:hypothetical protein
MAARMLSMSPYADTTTAFSIGATWVRLVSSVNPSITGMLMSLRTRSMARSWSIIWSASAPLPANLNSNRFSLISLRNRWRISTSRSGSSSTTRILNAMGYAAAPGSRGTVRMNSVKAPSSLST